MPYVPGFDYDLFVSYASADNHQGAVEDFVGALEEDISDNLVNFSSPQEKVRIYFDRERLATKTAVNWEDHLKAAASSSALLVSLLSPNYLSSEYCGKERDWFACASPKIDPTVNQQLGTRCNIVTAQTSVGRMEFWRSTGSR